MEKARIHHFKGFSVKRAGLEITLDMNRLEGNFNRAQYALDSSVMTSMVPYMPHRDGSFIQRTRAESAALAGSGTVIAAAAPMGRFLYQGKVMVDPVTGSPWARKYAEKVLTTRNLKFSKSHNPKAQAKWFDAAKAQDGDSWVNLVKETAGGGTNG